MKLCGWQNLWMSQRIQMPWLVERVGEWVANQDYIWGQQQPLHPSMIVRQSLRESECVH